MDLIERTEGKTLDEISTADLLALYENATKDIVKAAFFNAYRARVAVKPLMNDKGLFAEDVQNA